ncbi:MULTISPECIES: hypothetical protein [unclassified Streptomyces]|uniref:hypothetical protein n=1 Tax=unclassified Streptomyces TaxID=2593676 RepID=UPI002DD8EB90|nr:MULTISPECIES: hypothetical protein [unclassified Streptomyces]WSC34989.1 hypothetical protein OHA08_05330 [Streptomyces sp. NBC_01763]WSC57735.1 hypothetical protein OG808_38975 [Streptomyces sp. NBC_01761]WSF88839.1 hypothetical protein OIE70_40525 [Streptomyces sp. NBC_01744]
MSDNYLTVIPTDPYWRPSKDAADRAAAVLSGMLPDDDARHGLEAKWHDSVEVVFCGANLEKISCPRCRAESTPGWWGEAVSERYNEGFSTLMVTVPCCDAETSLNELVYDWPMGFAQFRIEVLYPNRAWLTDEELASLANTLGHPLRQILIHI